MTQNLVRVVSFSDTHARHRELQVPDGDIVICCGDFSTKGTQKEMDDFLDWFAALPHAHKVFVAGNHDIAVFDGKFRDWVYEPQDVHYLFDSGIELLGLSIWGTPWTSPTGWLGAAGRPRFIKPSDNEDFSASTTGSVD